MASGNLGVILHEKGTGRLAEKGQTSVTNVSFGGKSRTNDTSNLLNHPAVDIVVHVDQDVPSVLVLDRSDVHGPEHHGECDEHRVVRDVPPDAYPLPKAVHDVALILSVRRTRRERAVRIEVPRRVERRRVVAVNLRVVIAQPDVDDAHGPLRDEHALVPIVLDGTMRDPDGQNGPPSKDLFNHGTKVGQAGKIGEGRDSASTNHGVQLVLSSPLRLREGDHGKHPPIYRAGRSLCAGTANRVKKTYFSIGAREGRFAKIK